MAEYTPEEIEKAKQRFKEVAEQGRTQGDIRKSYHDIPDKPKTGGSGGTGGGMGTGKMNRDITKNYKSGGNVSSASKRGDGCCVKGKTKGRMV
jgi:hypothetical protein